ncbi:MAG TPA: hypothetical protein VFM21_12200 [Terriglobia bacterium]|nr:hypothetical protein [Terriglobia bacterium]
MGIGGGTTPGPLPGDAAGAAFCEINGLGGGATAGRGAVATVAPAETAGEAAAGAGGGGAFEKSGLRMPMMVDMESEDAPEVNGAGVGGAAGRAGD